MRKLFIAAIGVIRILNMAAGVFFLIAGIIFLDPKLIFISGWYSMFGYFVCPWIIKVTE